jgi:hypothetical protein
MQEQTSGRGGLAAKQIPPRPRVWDGFEIRPTGPAPALGLRADAMAFSLYRGPPPERTRIMWLSSWLRNGKRSAPTTRRRTPTSPRQRAGFRPQLEALEDRCVPSTLTVTNTYASGKGSLAYEIAAAQSGDTIVFNFGKKVTGYQTINLDGSELYINKNLTIQGPSSGLAINDGGLSRVFEVAAGARVQLSGLTIENIGTEGNIVTLQYGGGILNHGVLTVTDCDLYSNEATYGGGIYNDGTLTVSGSGFENNYATNGQGPDSFGSSDGVGGGIYNAGTASINSCHLESNRAVDAGGGIYNAGTASISFCDLESNTAGGFNVQGAEGGGIYNGGTATVSFCEFDYYNYLNNTVYSNSAQFGSDIYNGGTLTVSDTNFYLSYGAQIYGSYTDGGGNTFS